MEMKRLILIMALFMPFLLEAQKSEWGVYPSLGIDMGGAIPFPFSDIPDGAKGTPKLNPNLALGIGHSINEKWNLKIEAGYHILAFSAKADVRSQPFYFDNREDILYFSGKTSTDVELRLLEFPLMAEYKLNPNWSLVLGNYYTRILEGTFNTKGTDGVLSDDKTITDSAQLPGVANTSYSFNDYIDKWDAGFLIGYRYFITPNFTFWGRLQVGLKSIFVKEFHNIDYEMYQVYLNTGVSLTLFSGKGERRKGKGER